MLDSILDQLDQLTSEELLTLNKAVVRMSKAKSRVESVAKGASLKAGQQVQVDHPKYRGMNFVIAKVNRTRCKIKGDVGTLNCPISMIVA